MFKSKKSLGQNFLNSSHFLKKMVEAGDTTASDTVIEIGPGHGSLTQFILSQGARVKAIEKDRRLIPILGKKFDKEISSKKLEIIEQDILNYECKDKDYKIIANIPYYITGEVIRKFLEIKNQPKTMVLLLQKEVANRIIALDKKESILSLSVKAYGTPKIIAKVPRGAFRPIPNVDSAIIAINNITKDFFKELPEAFFFKVIKKAFLHKRKFLMQNLELNPKQKNEMIKLGISPKSRAEDLDLSDWKKICLSISKER